MVEPTVPLRISPFYLNHMGYKGASSLSVVTGSSGFYLNHMGYKVCDDSFNKEPLYIEFYLNHMGYKENIEIKGDFGNILFYLNHMGYKVVKKIKPTPATVLVLFEPYGI